MALGEKRYIGEREEDREKPREEKDTRSESYVSKELGSYVVLKEEEKTTAAEESTVAKEYLLENLELPAKAAIVLTEPTSETKFVSHKNNPEDEIKLWLVQEWEEHSKQVEKRKGKKPSQAKQAQVQKKK